MTEQRTGTQPAKRRRNAPPKREVELAEKVRDAADDLTKASDFAETYMARVALGNAIRALQDWASAGRPHA